MPVREIHIEKYKSENRRLEIHVEKIHIGNIQFGKYKSENNSRKIQIGRSSRKIHIRKIEVWKSMSAKYMSENTSRENTNLEIPIGKY